MEITCLNLKSNIMWETEVRLLMVAFVKNRRTFKNVESDLIKKYGRISVKQFRLEALERLKNEH
jgi:hypothetical protein